MTSMKDTPSTVARDLFAILVCLSLVVGTLIGLVRLSHYLSRSTGVCTLVYTGGGLTVYAHRYVYLDQTIAEFAVQNPQGLSSVVEIAKTRLGCKEVLVGGAL